MTTLGDRIRDVARERGMSLNQVAERAGLARPYLNKVLAGSPRSPGIVNMAKIARALGVPVDYLLVGVDGIDGPEELSTRDMAALLRLLGRTEGMSKGEIARLLEAEEDQGAPRHRAGAQKVAEEEPGYGPEQSANNE